MSAEGKHLFTSESVTEGHPDKVADQISDAILDAIIAKDTKARVACETLVTTGLAFVTGEITTNCYADIPSIVRRTIREIGYTRAKYGFDCETCAVITAIDEQSPDIALGVDIGGAGDQGLMFGYACRETPELMPLPIILAHRLAHRLAEVRKQKVLDYLRPDGKTQVTIEYFGDRPIRVSNVILAAQHNPNVDIKKLRHELSEVVINYTIPEEFCDKNTIYYINPTGKFVSGGPLADSGMTGRKIIVDTYGGVGSHGGGCFSGKDPTKVDRSASYMARYIAKNAVAAGLADKIEIQLAYAIGVVDPVSVFINTMGTAKIPEDRIKDIILSHFKLSPRGIIEHLNLLRPIYRRTAVYGHFGREEEGFTWEKTDMASILKSEAGL